MEIYENKPIGYCPGVGKAIFEAFDAQQKAKKKIYSYGQVVHNELIVSELIRQGIEPIEDLSKLKKDDVLLFPAHGPIFSLKEELQNRGIKILETTCPTIKNLHNRIRSSLAENKKVIFVGKKNHSETNSVLSISQNVFLFDINSWSFDDSNFDGNNSDVYIQTTLQENAFTKSKEILNNKFSGLNFFDSRCEEVKKRLDGIANLPKDVDVVFVIGGTKSSNTKELLYAAKQHFYTTKIYQVTIKEDIPKKDIKKITSCAIISGSSTPQTSVLSIKRALLGF